MPYTHKKVGSKFVVYKKGKKVGETEGTKTALNKYLAALHIADKKSAKKEVKSLKENQQMQEARVDDNITFWVVEKPKSPTDDPMNLYFETDPLGFVKQIMGGLRPEEILGFYESEDGASMAAHDQVEAVMEAAKALEKKKEDVSGKLEERIKKLQKEVNRCMEEGDDMKAQQMLERIAQLRSKRQMVEASKKEIEKSEEK